MKALTMMEHHDTSYLFVVDAGVYRRTLTTQASPRGWCTSKTGPEGAGQLHLRLMDRYCTGAVTGGRQAWFRSYMEGRPSGLSAPPFEVRRRSAIG